MKSADEFLRTFTRQFTELTGASLETLGNDARRHIGAAARHTFERMDLVPREEFEAQKAVLLRTRERLEALEREVAELEKQLSEK